MTAKDAITRSITHTEIVHLEHDSNVAEDLAALCDDSVRAEGVTEYWGTEDGSAWRVHLVGGDY